MSPSFLVTHSYSPFIATETPPDFSRYIVSFKNIYKIIKIIKNKAYQSFIHIPIHPGRRCVSLFLRGGSCLARPCEHVRISLPELRDFARISPFGREQIEQLKVASVIEFITLQRRAAAARFLQYAPICIHSPS